MKNPGKTLFLGIYAGVAISFGGFLNIIANSLLNASPLWGRIAGSLLFPIGLTLVCVFGFNLFTGKIGFLLDNKKDYLGFLALVYLGNILGSLAFGALSLLIFKGSNLYLTALSVSQSKMFPSGVNFLSIIKVFSGAVLCGVLVYLAILSYRVFKNYVLRIVGIFVSIGLFVFLKFDHCIANMFYFAFSWSYDRWESYLNIVIVTLGNSFGAIFFNEGLKAFKKLTKKNG